VNKNDAEWIRQAQAGDQKAFGEIVRRYQGLVYGWAFHLLGNFPDAEDIAQEVFLEAYLSLSRLQNPDKFSAWLRQMTYYRCVDLLRRRKDFVSLDEEIEEDEDEIILLGEQLCNLNPTPLENCEVLETKEQIQLALSQLSENNRLAINLYYFSGKSYKEIADFLGVPVSTIEGRLYRAKKQLREVLTMVKEGLEGKRPDESFTKKVLEKIQAVPAISTLIGTFDPLLKALGQDWSASYITGVLGHAFCFSMRKDAGEVWQTSAIDWWLFFDVLKHFGYDVLVFDAVLNNPNIPAPSPEEYKAIKERAWEAVKANIDRGIPAVAWTPMTLEQKSQGTNAYEWALLVGYDSKEKTYTVRHITAGEYTVPYDGFGYTDPVNWFCVIVFGSRGKFHQMAVEVASLQRAVDFAHGREVGADWSGWAEAGGFAAYELYREAYQSGNAHPWHGPKHAGFLRGSRSHAARYLREIVEHFPKEGAEFLRRAAVAYDEEAKIAAKLKEAAEQAATPLGRDDEATQQDIVSLISSALEAEQRAIGNIEKTLAALPSSLKATLEKS